MSMTLEEAIEQIERTYKENHSGWLYALKRGETKYAERCKKSIDESRQLVEWLKELKAVKNLIKQHDEDSMPEDFWYIDKIREVVQE